MAAFDTKIHGSLPNGWTILRMVFAGTLANIAGNGKRAEAHEWHVDHFPDQIPIAGQIP